MGLRIRREFATGLRAAVPVMLGYLPIAFSFGLAAHGAGLPAWTAALMSALVYTGAGQFAALGMLGAGAPLPEIVLAVLFMNLRHVVLNLALLPRLKPQSLWRRAVVAMGVTDETFAVAAFSHDPALTRLPGLVGLNCGAWLSWSLGTLLGGWAALLVPRAVNDAMAVMLYGLFIGLLVPVVRKAPRGLLVAVAAMAIHVACRRLMAPGWALVCAIVAGAAVIWLLPERRGETL